MSEGMAVFDDFFFDCSVVDGSEDSGVEGDGVGSDTA